MDSEAIEPCGGIDGIIGALHSNGLTANITSYSYNGANEVLIARANAYQTMLLGALSGGESSPDLTQVKKDVRDLQNKVDSIHLEWEDLLFLSE